ncbi:MAG: RNA polymerase sigma factor [Phycisphaerae bacterium]|nr:RNA polymerase sigma factor [Phycisphaerae bacterium]
MERGDYTELVTKAQGGDEESMNRLATMAQESLRRYVFRITLDEPLTQDIVQEVMLEMVKVLGKLKRADRFVAWLHGIAFNLLRRHYGDKWRERATPGGAEEAESVRGATGEEGLANLINAELKQIIFSAMNHIEPRHRAVLTMRCYDEMSYKEIAERMGTRELTARALFFRAKSALAKQLSRRGLGRGSLLTALVLFGKMTAASEAAAAQVAVTAATLKVGIAAGVVGAAGGEAAAVTLAAAAMITTATVIAVRQEGNTGPAAVMEASRPVATAPADASAGEVRECWYYFPEGVDGPVMMRNVHVGRDGRQRYKQWLQNNSGNYCYDPRGGTITLTNHRMWESDYSVRRLPTDSPELSDFISQVQGDSPIMEHIGSRGRDLLVIATSGGDASGTTWTTRHCNALEEDYFKCDWPRRTTLADARDEMHRRGWTYFTVQGQLRGQTVSGVGYLPFVYEASRTRQAWLSLHVGDRHIAGDTGGLIVHDANGRVIEKSPAARGDGIFAGLPRPWAGLHTIDTIRRDAAAKRIRFETRVEGRSATVVLHCGDLKLQYAVDMLDDLVNEITFTATDGTQVGNLTFSYDKATENGIVPPRLGAPAPRASSEAGDGIMWLVKLVADAKSGTMEK